MIDKKQIKSFKSQEDFRDWMFKNSTSIDGIWVKLYRKNSGVKSINYQDALDVALCFGWIDGQVKKLDDINSWVQRFTPRRKGSIWSKRNVENAERLIKTGQMTQQGQKEVNEAKKDGRWQMAYGSQVDFIMPEDFLNDLKKNKKAEEFFNTLNRSSKYTIYWKLQTVKKSETREKWKNKFLEALSKNEKIQ